MDYSDDMLKRDITLVKYFCKIYFSFQYTQTDFVKNDYFCNIYYFDSIIVYYK